MFVVTHLSSALLNIEKKGNLKWNSYALSPVRTLDEFAL